MNQAFRELPLVVASSTPSKEIRKEICILGGWMGYPVPHHQMSAQENITSNNSWMQCTCNYTWQINSLVTSSTINTMLALASRIDFSYIEQLKGGKTKTYNIIVRHKISHACVFWARGWSCQGQWGHHRLATSLLLSSSPSRPQHFSSPSDWPPGPGTLCSHHFSRWLPTALSPTLIVWHSHTLSLNGRGSGLRV